MSDELSRIALTPYGVPSPEMERKESSDQRQHALVSGFNQTQQDANEANDDGGGLRLQHISQTTRITNARTRRH